MFELSFLKDTQHVLYVGPRLNWFQLRRLKKLENRVSVIYLPDILRKLSSSSFKYFFPSSNFTKRSLESIYAKVRIQLGEDISPKSRIIVRYDGDDLVYYDAQSSFSDLLEYLKEESSSSILYEKTGRTAPPELLKCVFEESERNQSFHRDSISDFDIVKPAFNPSYSECVVDLDEAEGVQFNIVSKPDAESTFDSHMSDVAKEVQTQIRILIKCGYPVAKILTWLSQTIELSRLRITKQYKIVLVDYDIEIKMGPLPKTIFLFYLLHPEGVGFSYLQDYKEQIMEIYGKVCKTDNPDKMEESIGRLIDPFDNSICEKCAAVKKAFISSISDSIAHNYYISGKQGYPKFIKLDRSLVEWECDLNYL